MQEEQKVQQHVPNVLFFLGFPFLLMMVVICFEKGIKKFDWWFLGVPFISFIIFSAVAVLIGILISKIFFKKDFDTSNALILPRNWKKSFTSSWEAVKFNSLVLIFVFFVTSMLGLFFLENSARLLGIVGSGILGAFLPPLTIIYIMMKTNKEFLEFGKAKLTPQGIFLGWIVFFVLMLRVLSAAHKGGSLVVNLSLALAPFIVLVILALRKKKL